MSPSVLTVYLIADWVLARPHSFDILLNHLAGASDEEPVSKPLLQARVRLKVA